MQSCDKMFYDAPRVAYVIARSL